MNIIDLVIPGFLAFREGLEAVLVVVIVLLYLKRTKQKEYKIYVYIGAIGAIISSILFAFFFNALLGGFTGILEEVFEGITFILSGLFIVTLIIWISIEGPKMEETLEIRIEESIQTEKIFSITLVTYIIIIREGIELVLLLTGAAAISGINQDMIILGSLLGLTLSLIIGILMYFGVQTINLSKFFKITNVILILFATGLITYGIHELIEAGIINPFIEEIWNIKHILPEDFPDNNPITAEWTEIVGSLLKVLFGYNANPSLLEVVIYPTILIFISLLSYILWQKNQDKNKKNLK